MNSWNGRSLSFDPVSPFMCSLSSKLSNWSQSCSLIGPFVLSPPSPLLFRFRHHYELLSFFWDYSTTSIVFVLLLQPTCSPQLHYVLNCIIPEYCLLDLSSALRSSRSPLITNSSDNVCPSSKFQHFHLVDYYCALIFLYS